MMKSINPATGEVIKEYELMDDETVRSVIDGAHEAQKEWRQKSYDQRAPYLREIADILKSRKKKLAELMALEM